MEIPCLLRILVNKLGYYLFVEGGKLQHLNQVHIEEQ